MLPTVRLALPLHPTLHSKRAPPAATESGNKPSVEPIHHFIPGPCYVPEAVRAAMREPPIAHRSRAFKAVYADVSQGLRPVFRTAGDVFIATGSATLGMEIGIVSLVRSQVLNLTCGAFSERWHTISRALGRSADEVSVPWGEILSPDLVRQALRRKTYDAVTVVHSETSTGALNPIAEIAQVVRAESDALILVDAVSSLGGAPVETDAWGLDFVLTASQKALAVPPGLALFAASPRALERAAFVPYRGFYTDLLRYRDQHLAGSTITTPAEAQIYALRWQLQHILAEGVEPRWQRHRALREQMAGWVAAHGLTYASSPQSASPTISCLRPPAGWTAPQLVEQVAARGFVVAGGYGAWKSDTFRIGHMGEVRSCDLTRLCGAIEQILG